FFVLAVGIVGLVRGLLHGLFALLFRRCVCSRLRRGGRCRLRKADTAECQQSQCDEKSFDRVLHSITSFQRFRRGCDYSIQVTMEYRETQALSSPIFDPTIQTLAVRTEPVRTLTCRRTVVRCLRGALVARLPECRCGPAITLRFLRCDRRGDSRRRT